MRFSNKSTGNVWTALAHIITAVVGSGVLSLSWSVAQLGWIAGPLVLVLFAFVTLLNASLLNDLYRYSDNGIVVTNSSYLQAVQNILGDSSARVCAFLVYFNLFKLGVVYTITSASSIKAIEQSNCYHEQGHDAACEYGVESYMLLFGIIHIIASQIPDFRSTKWLSVIAAVMSFMYSLIGSVLGLARVIGKGKIEGSIGGVPTDRPIQKVWLVAQAIGDIAFSYPFHLIFLETQSTLKSPPSEEVTMKKASRITIFTTTVFYFCCGGFGYAAFGNSTPGNILTGFGFYEPYWLIDFANACVFLHLVGGYQNILCNFDNSLRDAIPLLQRSGGICGFSDLLALGCVLSGADVLCAEKDCTLDLKVGSSLYIHHSLLVCSIICLGWFYSRNNCQKIWLENLKLCCTHYGKQNVVVIIIPPL